MAPGKRLVTAATGPSVDAGDKRKLYAFALVDERDGRLVRFLPRFLGFAREPGTAPLSRVGQR